MHVKSSKVRDTIPKDEELRKDSEESFEKVLQVIKIVTLQQKHRQTDCIQYL